MASMEVIPGPNPPSNSNKPPIPHKSGTSFALLVEIATVVAVIAIIATHAIPYGCQDAERTYALCTSNGKGIYTVDDDNRLVECILIHNEYIVDTGNLEDIRDNAPATIGSSSFKVQYTPRGAIVVPGLSDSHCHILEYGASRQIPLSDGKSAKETVAFVGDYIANNPDIIQNKSQVIEGWGWDHASWDVEQWPTWRDFEADPMVAGRPVVLQSRDGHAIWVSKKALEDNAPFPDNLDGGVIFRDEHGDSTGVFMDSAQDLITRPPPTDHDLKRFFRTTVNEALAVGLTSLHDAGFKPDSLAFFKREADSGPLPLRIYGMTFFDEHGKYWGDKIEPLIGGVNDRLSARSVKIFADGALRTGGAALYAPYSDNPSTSGAMRISADVLESVIPRFLRDGWQVNVHAIGDRANGIVLDAFKSALIGANVSSLRPRLEHAQIMTSFDMARLGDFGVIASIQPTHAISDMWFAEDRLGQERVKGLYAFRSILENGARITIGSDFPVEEINPLKGFYAAVTRLSTDGTSPHGPGGWFPEQRLSRVEALRGMTIDAAYASFTENILGSLVSGKKADYVVLSQDIMEVPSNKIMETKVIATAIDGHLVYGNLY